MTAPLWPDLDVCGCPRGVGHTCRPAWMTKDEWAPATPDDAPEGDEQHDSP